MLEIVTIIAIILGPILAVLVTRLVDGRRQLTDRKLRVFRDLVATRGLRLDPMHVSALNLVEIEFYHEKTVREKFERYIAHLSSPLPMPEEQDRYFENRGELFYDLLQSIGKSVGYKFDKMELERRSYSPEGWMINRNTQLENAELMKQVLRGERPIPIAQYMGGQTPFPPPPADE